MNTATSYIAANLTNCKLGIVNAYTYVQGMNVEKANDNHNQLDIAGKEQLGECLWKITFTSRPSAIWTPSSTQIEAAVAEYGVNIQASMTPQTKQCGPVPISMVLGSQ